MIKFERYRSSSEVVRSAMRLLERQQNHTNQWLFFATRVYATLAYLEPVTVILAGWWLFNESLPTLQLGGVLLIILTGLLLARRHKAVLPELVLPASVKL